MDMTFSGGSVDLVDQLAQGQLHQHFLIALRLCLDIQKKPDTAGLCAGINLRMISADNPFLFQLVDPGLYRNP
jgi:hypothetical protein